MPCTVRFGNGFYSGPAEAFELIRSSSALRNRFPGKYSPLSEQSKSELFNALNNRDLNDLGRPVGEALVEFSIAQFGGFVLSKALGWGLGRLAAEGAAKGAAKGGSNLVYQGFDKAGVVRYVGITERKAAVRFGEHLSSGTAKSFLRYEVVSGATNLSRTEARVWEQTLINQYGLEKNVGLLQNKINSIAPKKWWQYSIK